MLKSKNAKKILQSQNKPNLDYLCPTRLQTRVNCLPYEKPAYNNTTFNEAVKALQSFTKVNNITDQVYLDFANFEEHYKFHAGKVENGSNETFKKMEELRWKNIIAPKILKFSKEYKIFEHIFPKKFKTKVQLTCNWQYTKWLGMYGHDVPPNWCLYSPTVNIVTNSPKEKLYTLMMTDLDRPYPKDGILEEWCHWKIVNIPVKERLEIRGGESVFLKSNPDNVNCFNLQTRFPFRPNQEKRKQVGDTIFPYIPPHPAHSNPRLTRRYLFTLIEQKELIDVEKYKNDLKLQSVKEYKKKNTVEELKEMEYVERGLFLPTWKYVTETKSKIASYGFIRSSWNIMTPIIYKSLGLHEPVYGELPKASPKVFIDRIQESMKHIKLKNSVLKGDKDEATGKNNEELSLIRSVINSASTPYPLVLSRDVLSQAPVTTKFVDLINLGRKNTIPAIVKPSKALKTSLKKQLELKKMKELSLQKQSKKEGKKIEELELEEKEKIQKWRSNVKVPRMTSVGAVGLAKSSELQIKNNVVGPIMKKVLFENDRFRNV